MEERERFYPLTARATARSPATGLLSLIDGLVQPVHARAADQVFLRAIML